MNDYPIWEIGYTYKDGGSTWYVKAESEEDALNFVKDVFRKDYSWDGVRGSFYISKQNVSIGNVFGGTR